MTRYHYIKKLMYLQYRLTMLASSANCYCDTRYSKWNSLVLYPPFENGAKTYQEAWDRTCEAMRSIDGLEDLK